jgi:hypothetical protein
MACQRNRELARRCLTIAIVLILASSALAQSKDEVAPTLAGSWTASPLTTTWKLGDWGKACGPPPSGGGAPGGPVTITERGNELTFIGAGRVFSTTECWEQLPNLQRISHSASGRRFQNVCATPKSDPRQARLVTTISASDARVDFDETGQYQFVIEGQNCTASVRRTRVYTLVQREGEAPKSAPSAEPPPPAPTRNCETSGLPERLEVRPSRKLMRPGESFSFRTSVFDARGCAVPVTPAWSVVGAERALTVKGPGQVMVAADAAEAEVALEVTLGDRYVRVVVEIVSRERYEGLLAARGLDASGESQEAAVLRVATESVGSRQVVVRKQASRERQLLVAVAGGTALLLGVVGLMLVRRSRRKTVLAASSEPEASRAPEPAAPSMKACPTCREEFPADAEFCPNDGNRLVQQSSLPAGPGGAVCPVCGRGFNPGTAVCPEHGEELIPASAFSAARAPSINASRTICPVCGSQFGGGVRFCGECGASVVPIN